MKKNEIVLKFGDQATFDWINTISKRKGYDLAEYIIGNFEWDEKFEKLSCIDELGKSIKITSKVCEGCDFRESCPDVVK